MALPLFHNNFSPFNLTPDCDPSLILMYNEIHEFKAADQTKQILRYSVQKLRLLMAYHQMYRDITTCADDSFRHACSSLHFLWAYSPPMNGVDPLSFKGPANRILPQQQSVDAEVLISVQEKIYKLHRDRKSRAASHSTWTYLMARIVQHGGACT